MFGLFIREGDDAGNKCVFKTDPHERVGIVCKKAGKYNVVEYSELSEEIAVMTNADMWGRDLTQVPGFEREVARILSVIRGEGELAAYRACL